MRLSRWMALALGAALSPAADLPRTSYEREIAQWRAQQEAELKADDGWLTVVGLAWLKEGDNRVGSDPTGEVPLPKGSAPARVGTISLRGGQATFHPATGAGLTLNGKPARETALKTDTDVFAINRLSTNPRTTERRGGVRDSCEGAAAHCALK